LTEGTEKKTIKVSLIYQEKCSTGSDRSLELKITKTRNRRETEEKKTETKRKLLSIQKENHLLTDGDF